jgi:hypothetical protein
MSALFRIKVLALDKSIDDWTPTRSTLDLTPPGSFGSASLATFVTLANLFMYFSRPMQYPNN